MPGGETDAGTNAGQVFRWVNLALAFFLELCALGSLGYWGVETGGGLPAKALLGVGAPLVAAVLWGMFAAPRAPVSTPVLKIGTQLAVFGSAALALYATGHGLLALIFVLVTVVNGVLVRLL